MPKTKRGKRPYVANWHGRNGLAAATWNLTKRLCCWWMTVVVGLGLLIVLIR